MARDQGSKITHFYKFTSHSSEFVLRFSFFSAIAWILAFCVGSICGQGTVGTIVGTATAPDGTAISGVTVTVINEGTITTRTAITDQQGNYAVPDLNPGSYTVTIAAPGFAPLRDTGVVLTSQQTIRIDLPLKIGSVSTQVNVTIGAPVLDSQMSSISNTLSETDINKTSTNLIGTVDGTGDSGLLYFVYTLPAATGPDFAWSVAGSRGYEAYYNVDGITLNSAFFGNMVGPSEPGFAIVQEVKYDSVNNKAEFGSLLNVTTITKSGTNQFHGTVFEHNSNDAVSAQNYFSTSKGKFNENNFGAGLGGPIFKNRLFFFGSFEGLLDSLPATVVGNLPTTAMRGGDFSSLLAGPKPTVLTNPYTGQPFPNNQIPASLLSTPASQSAQAWQKLFYPDPNFGPPDQYNANFRGTFPQTTYNNRYDIRLDANTSPNNSLFVRFSYDRASPEVLDSQLPPSVIGTRVQTRWNYQGVISDTWVITPNLFNVAKIGGFHTENDEDAKGPLFGQPLLDKIGITGFPVVPATIAGIPTLSINNFTSPVQLTNQTPIEATGQVIDQLTYQRGNHTIKGGFEFRPQQVKRVNYPNFGTFTFNGKETGFSYADFLLGLPQATSYKYGQNTIYARFHFINGFLQDDWRVTPNLVLNYGIRYDYDSAAVDKYNLISSFDPATGAIVVPSLAAAEQYKNPAFPSQIPIESAQKAGFPMRSLRNAFPFAVYPRLGFAYSIGKNTVIKGGYGVFNDDISGPTFTPLYQSPYGGTIGYTNSFNGTTPGAPCSVAAPCTPSITFNHPVNSQGQLGAVVLNSLAVNLRNPYVQQTNLTLEQNIGFNTSLRLSYIGTFASDLLYNRNINQVHASTTAFNQANTPYPLYQLVYQTANGGIQNYNGFTAEVNRHLKQGLLFEAALTYSKELTDDPSETGQTGVVAENTYNLGRQYGNDQYSPRLGFVSNVIWSIPVGRGGLVLQDSRLWGNILGGWQLSGGYFQHTGQYLTPTFAGADSSNTNQFSGTADRIGNPAPIGSRSINNWFNPAAYAIPKNGTFGNAGFGSLKGPGSSDFNLGIFKIFALPRKSSLDVSATFTNVLNHPNFGNPDVVVTDTTAGKITSIQNDFYGPRSGLLSARYSF